MDDGKSSREKILVVDDDPTISRLLGEALEIEGYQPIICSHPNEVLAICEQETFDLAFLDINLPGMSGLDLAATLKEHDPLREIVFITGYGSGEDVMEAISAGASDYLRKPFSLGDFNLCLRRFQSRKSLREHLRRAEQRYYDLVQNIPLIIYVLRKDLHLDFINDACSLILGFTPEEAMNAPNWFLGRIHPQERERVERLFRSAFESGRTLFSVECRLIHKNGRSVHAILRSIPYREGQEGSEVDRLAGILVDITDRLHLEGRLPNGKS
jgi:PAS domain S-box-containing protein